ncbi:hypothetical protein [Henriciella aquimarina]|uniref:hypothetical protein n=1 Tax=Henriciella aquimarina TaxID=545261 RepID=UPI000A063204|nr:hypothetical protein [Henriciella aquimarina]
MAFKRIVLRLARNPDFPNGDAERGYILKAPLTAGGELDLDEWREHRQEAVVIRFDPDPDERADGWLTHRGSHWFFHYDEDHEGPDEPTYRLGDHKFAVGEYITVSHHDGDALTYKVTDVVDA